MKKLEKIIPKYTYIPFALCGTALVLAFYATRFFTTGGYHYDIATALDDKIPFIPGFIAIYVLAYVQWVFVLWLATRESRDTFFQACAADILGKLIAIPIFLLFPTAMVRPEITGSGFFEGLTKLIYTLDAPDNLFPSLHCFDSWLCLRYACSMKKAPGWFKWANGIFSVLVFASVVLVKQHLVLDILGGILLGEAAFGACKALRAERAMHRIVPKQWQKEKEK